MLDTKQIKHNIKKENLYAFFWFCKNGITADYSSSTMSANHSAQHNVSQENCSLASMFASTAAAEIFWEQMKENGLCSWFKIIQKKRGGESSVLPVLLNSSLFYCELNWSGTQEEEEFEMQWAEKGQGEGRDKGWEA